MSNHKSRRDFIRTGAVATAGFFIVPRHVLGGPGYIAPSDRLNIAGIGAGGKGASDLSEFAKSPKVNIVSFCDVDEAQAAGSVKRFPKAKFYYDFREMLEKEKNNIDAVSVSTPDHTHAIATLAAMEMGKHVYVQKPLTHDIYEARMLTEAAKKYKVVTQMGNQGGSGDGVRLMKEWYDAKLIGKVTNVYAWTNRPVWPQGLAKPTGAHTVPANFKWDLWIGPSKYEDYNPAYHPFNWRGWWSFGTGALGDMACHIMDPIYRILPILYPNEVECSLPNQFTAAWTEAGYIDSCPPASMIHLNYPRIDGKGEIKLTGNLGNVMKESATTALSYLQANAKKYGIDPAVFSTKNIHVHVPEGATPKDGPSAGITMLTSLTSAFTGRKVKPYLAMTGEITLRGQVLPVGGIKEKILAAKRAGMKEIILCWQNEKDINEIDHSFIKGLQFHYVKNMQQVLDLALV